MRRTLATCLLGLWALSGAAFALRAAPGLSAGPNGSVLKDGKPYRGVGINYFDCFHRVLRTGKDTSYDAGFRILARHRVPFARFSASGFWPRDHELYRTDRAEYFRRLDGVVRSAEQHGVGLVPSLFWFVAAVPDLVGEPCDQWGNPASRTHAFMRDYVRDVVTRYRESPAIWAWEFGNEHNAYADLPDEMKAKYRPKLAPDRGTPSERTSRDDITHAALTVAFREFAREVRRHDPHRLIATGADFPRVNAWHFAHERNWKTDTPEQFTAMLALSAPEPADCLSVHCYEKNFGRIEAAAAAAASIGKPLFVGEFQVPASDTPAAREAFEEFLAKLQRLGVPLAAVWVFDFAPQEKDWNITATNARGWQLQALEKWNANF